MMILDLPYELLELIFLKLDVQDYGNCRLVSKKCEKLIRSIMRTELIIGNRKARILYKWNFTDDLVNIRNEIMVDTIPLIWKLPFRITNLTRLQITIDLEADESNVSSLCRLTHLKQLEIWNLTLVNRYECLVLRLPALKMFHIWEVYVIIAGVKSSFELDDVPRYPLNVDTPQLKSFGCYNGYASESGSVSVNLLHPESIENLEVIPYGMDLRMFRNVKRFECGNSCGELNRKLMTFFPQLQELHFDQSNISDTENAELVARKMNYFVLQRQRPFLKKQHVKIYFQDIELIDGKRFEDYGIDLLSLMHDF